jgi:hypothetical protein
VLGRRNRGYAKQEDRRLMLRSTDLRGANLLGAYLEGANLMLADLRGARNVTVEQLSVVFSLYRAHLDPPLRGRVQQQYPHLLEYPLAD